MAQAAVAVADASSYPDASYTALRTQLASFHGVSLQRVQLAASASEFIFRITAVAAQHGASTVWLPKYSYGDYAQAAHAHRLKTVASLGEASLLWACEPSSPLGQSQANMAQWWQAVDGGATGILDRAYEPLRLAGAGSLSDAQLQRVWQLWTPHKALGLTGVRAAYAIAPVNYPSATLTQLEQLCPSWPIGAHGVSLLTAWTQADVQAWLAGSLGTLRLWKSQQLALCEAMAWTCLPSQTNFYVARPNLPAGLTLAEALNGLRAEGIKLRDTTSFGLPDHVRLSVQPPAAQCALQTAWRHVMAEHQKVAS
jgi:histidinol-phosphate aminotransferase